MKPGYGPGAALVFLCVFFILPAQATPRVTSDPVLAFDLELTHWDGKTYRVRLHGGDAILGGVDRDVRVTPRVSRGWTVRPVTSLRRQGSGWVARGRSAEERLVFRVSRSGRPAQDTFLVLLTPQPFRAGADGLVRGPGFVFPLGRYPESVPSRFAARAAAMSARFYVVRDTRLAISPHFRIGEFLSHTRPGRPETPGTALLALDYGLVDALERLQVAWTRAGRPGLVRVESPFRTPDYNNADEAGRATFSLHMYGSAVDVLVSSDTDRLHDDINRDGSRDLRDILPLARLVKRLMNQGTIPKGGIGLYRYTYHDGREDELTVHLDVRGYVTTWGQFYDSDTVRPAAKISWE